MSKKLGSYVHVTNDEGVPHAFGPDDKVPAWAVKKIGDHAFVDDGEADPDTASRLAAAPEGQREPTPVARPLPAAEPTSGNPPPGKGGGR